MFPHSFTAHDPGQGLEVQSGGCRESRCAVDEAGRVVWTDGRTWKWRHFIGCNFHATTTHHSAQNWSRTEVEDCQSVVLIINDPGIWLRLVKHFRGYGVLIRGRGREWRVRVSLATATRYALWLLFIDAIQCGLGLIFKHPSSLCCLLLIQVNLHFHVKHSVKGVERVIYLLSKHSCYLIFPPSSSARDGGMQYLKTPPLTDGKWVIVTTGDVKTWVGLQYDLLPYRDRLVTLLNFFLFIFPPR